MLWVTWRQHRGLLSCVLAGFAVAVAGMLYAGLKIHHDYAIAAACHPAGATSCLLLTDWFNTDWHLGNGIRVALLAAPLLLAMFAAPVVARELEGGTYRYAWTQGIGRVRWTVAKLTIIGSVVTIAALVLSQLYTWLFVPFLTTQDLTVLSPAVFDTRGAAYAAWTLTAFCLGAFLGTLIRRVLPAMAVSLCCFAALAAVTVLSLQRHYPVAAFWPRQLFESGWLLTLSAVLVAGTVRLVRRHAA
ncbi:MAG TPA: hypothetical protein VMI73_27430 [Trebonia sp.]|nr:hypothetical protein [Trebonia sp.]